jgi:hypothetical protein
MQTENATPSRAGVRTQAMRRHGAPFLDIDFRFPAEELMSWHRGIQFLVREPLTSSEDEPDEVSADYRPVDSCVSLG